MDIRLSQCMSYNDGVFFAFNRGASMIIFKNILLTTATASEATISVGVKTAKYATLAKT